MNIFRLIYNYATYNQLLANDIQECAICLNETSLTTVCNHFICDSCYLKIKNNGCPICRKKRI